MIELIFKILRTILCKLIFIKCKRKTIKINYFELKENDLITIGKKVMYLETGKYKEIKKVCSLCGSEDIIIERLEDK